MQRDRVSFFISLLLCSCYLLVYASSDENEASDLCSIDKRACALAAELADEQSKPMSSSMEENASSTEILNRYNMSNEEPIAGIQHGTSSYSTVPTSMLNKEHRLDDVSIDDMDEDFDTDSHHSFVSSVLPGNDLSATTTLVSSNFSSTSATKNTTECVEDGRSYKTGEKFNRGCDETCQCLKGGEIICSQQCKPPYFKKGTASMKKDSHCIEETVLTNPCCVILRCSSDNGSDKTMVDTTESATKCVYKNESYDLGTSFKDGCESLCVCQEDRSVSCKPRCSPIRNLNKTCITVPDANDPCCMSVLCDVEGQEVNKIGSTASEDGYSMSMVDNQIISAVPVNSTSVKLTFREKPKHCELEISLNGIEWNVVKCTENVVSGLQSGENYHFRLKNLASNVVQTTIPSENQSFKLTCEHKGKTYNKGDEFHDGCDAYCVCDKSGIECAPIECPTDFGLDVLDPQCLDWETHPADFVASPPNCCPDKVHCKDNGSCIYNDQNFPNWSEIPTKLSGCDKRCYCEMGNVTCQQVCPPVPAVPPASLPCKPQQAVLSHMTGDDCCLFWICLNNGHHGNENKASAEQDNELNKILSTTTGLSTSGSNDRMSLPTQNENIDKIDYEQTTNSNNSTTNTTTAALRTSTPRLNDEYGSTSSDKNFYPGPFSPQYIEAASKDSVPPAVHDQQQLNNRSSIFSKPAHKTSHDFISELLSPFHLEQYTGEIETDLESSNDTDLLPVKSGVGPHYKVHDDESSNDERDDDYDDEQQEDGDPFNKLMHSKVPHKGEPPSPSHKQTLWTVKPDLKRLPPTVQAVDEHFKHNNKHGSFYNATTTPQHKGGIGEFPPKKHPPSQKAPPSIDKDIISPYHRPLSVIPDGPPPPPNVMFNIGKLGNGGHFGPQEKLKSNKPSVINRPPEHLYHLIDNLGPVAKPVPDYETSFHFNRNSQQLDDNHFGTVVGPGNDGDGKSQSAGSKFTIEDLLNHAKHHHGSLPNFGYTNYEHESLDADQSGHPILPLRPEFGLHRPNHNGSQQGFGEQDILHNFPPLHAPSVGDIKIHTLEPIDENTVKLVFSVPPYIVGLHGRVELRYTSDISNDETSTWEQQILAPPNDLIATEELEFELSGLRSNTTYKIKIAMNMHDIANVPSSDIVTVSTLPRAVSSSSTTLPPTISIDPELKIIDINSTWAKLGWRTFTPFELQFIDGIQLRYKKVDDKVYSATPLIHRSVTTYVIQDLTADSLYEFGIYFIPFTGQTTELQSQKLVQDKTNVENDPYKFDLLLDVHHAKISSVEINWSGVPYPEDKYVNIYRAIYQFDGSREDFNTFKIAKRDSAQSLLIQDLKPNTKYRLWLEAYLTNGRIKKSNVKDFNTKAGSVAQAGINQGKLEGAPLIECNTYYGPLVAVSILAALAILSALILLLIMARKRATNKAPITNPINSRKNNLSSATYDNPSYKTCESNKAADAGFKTNSICLTTFQSNQNGSFT